MHATFVHANLVARDWRTLAGFYERVFGCARIGPERDLAGPALEAATGLPGARIRGTHLRLPGHGGEGPTLEIFEYAPPGPGSDKAIHRPGFGHIAFRVEDVAAARNEVLSAGGGVVGALTSVKVPGAGTVTFVYVKDPEDNVVELQSWEQDA